MKIAVWKTGHEIADTIANAFSVNDNTEIHLIKGLGEGIYIADVDTHIAYGILRGSDKLFRTLDNTNAPWFNIDNGYFNPGHFDGYYRISYKGTQAKWHEDIPKQDIDFELEGWQATNSEKWIMLCPPTKAVAEFYGVNVDSWTRAAFYVGSQWGKVMVRTKECAIPVSAHLKNCQGVITFNSSVGWQALQRGIPVYSDPDHSIIGSYYKAKMKNPIDFLSDEYRAIDRKPLFKAMRAHQFTLKEISEGKAWNLINHYLKQQDNGNGI